VVPKVVPKIPAGWTEADIAEERERCRLEEKATQERQKRDRDKKGIAGGRRLSDGDWDRLELLLRHVAGTRPSILETMSYCLDKSDWAIEIAECLTESLTIAETEMPTKLARLYVVSDILHNTTSSKPAAWAYRREFERSLPDILEHMHLSLIRLESKIDLEKFRDQVLKVLRVWEDWGLFAPQYTRGLEAALVVGVKSLRFLRSKGDSSREPVWMELKLNEWRRQHFSQLEKMCRTRGLRSSTSHLEPTRDLSLEEARQQWLIDRLACYELHWHDKEQAPARSKQVSMTDIDGEAIECDIDGFPLEEGALDGESVDLSDIGVLIDLMEAEKVLPPDNLGKFDLLSSADIEGMRSPSPVQEGASPFAQLGASAPLTTFAQSQKASANNASDDDGDALDLDQLEETVKKLEGAIEEPIPAIEETVRMAKEEEKKEKERIALRSIDLEIMELRADLQMQGLRGEDLQEALDERRKSMMDEHRAATESLMNKDGAQLSKSTRNNEDESESNSSGDHKTERVREKERGREKERERKDKEKNEKDKKEKDKAKDKDKDKDRDKEERSKKDKGKARGKDADSESPARARARSRGRDKKEKEKEKDKEKEKEKVKKRGSRSRSRSKEQAKKKTRR